MILKNVLKNKNVFLLIITLPFIFFSIYISRFIHDLHHHGLMFVNALDLINNKVPYKEIFILYGIATTAIHSLSLLIFGENLISINIITNILYFFSLFIISLIIKKKTNFFYGFLSLVILIFAHPVIWLPWSNYIAFFFLCLGSYILLEKNKNYEVYTGFILFLSCLSRENFFWPISISILIYFFFLSFFKTKNSFYKTLITFFVSFIIFIIFLKINNVYEYWFKIQLFPIVYSEYIKVSLLKETLNFIEILSYKSIFYILIKPQLIIISIILYFNIFFLAKIIKKKKIDDFFFISILSILLSINALNLEIFRLFTSISLGIIIVFVVLKNLHTSQIKKFFILFLSILSIYNLFFWNENNDTYKKINFNESFKNFNHDFLKYTLWNNNEWSEVDKIIFEKKNIESKCNLKHYANLNYNTFYSVYFKDYKRINLVPFTNNNIISNKKFIEIWSINEELKLIENLVINDDLIILTDNIIYINFIKQFKNYTDNDVSTIKSGLTNYRLLLFYPKKCL